ncbi:MAG: hypothetical protein M1839_000328 [Geoglossum umbratile]|nr:MAG: hypothetical protein M1839_000328 [Geoglossum umbratile]
MASTTLPGSYLSDLDLGLDTTPRHAAGVRSHFFQPPHTPSESSSLCRDSAFDTDTASITTAGTATTSSSRKRAHQEYIADTPLWSSDFAGGGGCASPAPFVNTRYRLAGGLDTPMAAEEEAREEGSRYYADVGYRRAWTGGDMGVSPHSGGNGGDNRGGSSGGTWGKVVLDVVGSVAGKVWEFCKTSAFRGFYAGGGVGYQLRNPSPQRTPARPAGYSVDDEDEQYWQDLDTTNNPATPMTPTLLHNYGRRSRSSTPIPGQFPQDDDYFVPPSPSQRPAKRVLRDKGGGELKMSWVMVPTPGSNGKRGGGSPAVAASGGSRKRSTPVASTAGGVGGLGRRKVITPHSHQRHSSTASRASTTTTPSHPPTKPSLGAASYASPRPSSSTTTPTNPLITKRLREEKEADRSIQRFNERLKEMIREGREALGSRWEVEEGEGLDIEEGGDVGVI